MAVQITIQDIPEAVRDKITARAAMQHQSMQEFFRCESEGIVSRPSLGAWLERARDRKEAAGSRVAPSSTLRARGTDRT